MPLDDLGEIKEQLRDLVLSGKKNQAIILLEKKYGVTPVEAEKLLGLALSESVNPALLIRGVVGRAVGNKKMIFGIIAFVMGFMGIPMLLASIGVYLYSNHKIENSVIIIGVVTELGPYQQTPIISYQVDGGSYSTDASVFSDEPEFSIGDSVRLYVNTSDPQSVIIDTFNQRWLMVVVTGMVGFSLVTSMIVLLLYRRKS